MNGSVSHPHKPIEISNIIYFKIEASVSIPTMGLIFSKTELDKKDLQPLLSSEETYLRIKIINTNNNGILFKVKLSIEHIGEFLVKPSYGYIESGNFLYVYMIPRIIYNGNPIYKYKNIRLFVQYCIVPVNEYKDWYATFEIKSKDPDINANRYKEVSKLIDENTKSSEKIAINAISVNFPIIIHI